MPARQCFFLTSPELSCMANEFKLQFNVKESKVTEHHGLHMSAIKRNHCSISKIKAAIMCHGNPITVKGPMLYNLITHAYIPEKDVPQILNMDDSGQKLYEDYVAERMAITKMLMDSLHQLLLIFFQHPRLSLRWYDVNAKETVHHGGVPANTITCNVQISACVTHHVRTMKSPTLKIVYLMTIVMTSTHAPSRQCTTYNV